MLTTVAILALLAVSAMGQYDGGDKKASTDSESEPEIGPEYYDEVLVVGQEGNVYAVTAQHGTTNWNEQELDVGMQLYKPQGVAICNGAVDDWDRWAYAYVADAGDEENAGAVYQFDIKRSAAEPGKIELENPKAIYGGGDDMEAAPTDVQCDAAKGGVFIADAKKGQVAWAPNNDIEEADPYVQQEEEADDYAVADVKQVAKQGDWLYWSVQGEDEAEANAIYRADASSSSAAKEPEKWAADVDAAPAYGVAVHNNKVLFTTGKGKVWEAGKFNDKSAPKAAKEWASGYGQAGYIASAGERGLLVADVDAGKLYVSKGEDKGNAIANVDKCGGVAYYEGLEWKQAEAEEEDAAASLTLAGVAVAAVAAAQL